MKQKPGFTVIELIVVIVLLLGVSILFIYQSNNLQATARDNQRKTDINTIYHNLTKVHYAKHKSYPKNLTDASLPAVLPDTFKDPHGTLINTANKSATGVVLGQSNYSYQPTGCNQQTDTCKSFTLKAAMELEAEYVKTAPKQ